VLESRRYFFTLTGTNLPANAQPYLKEVATGGRSADHSG